MAARRNYKNFLDGLFKVMQEGAIMRGAFANGCKLAAICTSMTSINDWCKENAYFWLGPHMINRFFATGVAVTVGTLVSMPFDIVRTRLYTMRPLPNGQLPYKHTFDVFDKMLEYECNVKKHSTVQSFYAGLQAYWIRLFAICMIS